MTRTIRIATLVALSAALTGMGVSVAGASGSAQASAKKPLLISNCNKPTFKPSRVILACGDASFGAVGMTWTSWTRRGAVGTGTGQVNDCTPDCVHGQTKEAPIQLAPGRPRTCSNGKRIFTKVKYTWLREVPKGFTASGSIPLGCKLFSL